MLLWLCLWLPNFLYFEFYLNKKIETLAKHTQYCYMYYTYLMSSSGTVISSMNCDNWPRRACRFTNCVDINTDFFCNVVISVLILLKRFCMETRIRTYPFCSHTICADCLNRFTWKFVNIDSIRSKIPSHPSI